jgi:diguanylate cyclase (GGDEF)-like protein
MLFVRAALIGSIAIGGGLASGLVGGLPAHAPAILAVWAGISALAEIVWRRSRRRGLPLFGATLIVDGLALVWLSEVGMVTNVRYLIFGHMVAVVLLASYRTGLKIALWDTLLLFTVFFAGRNAAFGLSRVAPGTAARWDLGQLTVFVAAVWLVAVATAVFSSVNERELRRRRFDLEALALFAVALEGAADRKTVAGTLLDSLADNFPVGRLLLLTAGRNPMVLGQRGVTAGAAPPPLELGSTLLRVQSTHETLLLSHFDPVSDPWMAEVLGSAGNFIVIPLYAEGGCVGVLVVEHAARNGSRVERRLVAIIDRLASHTALALRNAALSEQMDQMANTDGLTNAANRRAFQTTLEREVSRSLRSGDPVSLIMLDIDNFKALNDTHGHQVGDDVLRQVAGVLHANCRDFDTTARYGGEEFAVILPGCGPGDALARAEQLHRCVHDEVVDVRVTVSVGAAAFPVHATTAEMLVKAADDAMYEAKRAGRDRVRMAESPDALATSSGRAG